MKFQFKSYIYWRFFCNFQFSVSVFVKALQQMQILVGCQQTPFHWNMLLNEANPLQCIDSLHDWTSKPHNSLLPDFFLHLSLDIQDVFFNWDFSVSKFWHLELFWWDLLCNLTLRTFRGGPVKTRPSALGMSDPVMES